MAFGIVHYDATLAAVHPDRSTLPKGQLYHAAGESDGGWTVIAIHDSQQS